MRKRLEMLKNLLEEKKCFKLICGAGNENLDEVEKLVALYSKAGCHFFDVAANEEVLAAAQRGLSRGLLMGLSSGLSKGLLSGLERGLDFATPKDEQKDYHFCVSFGTKNDQHVQKAKIDVEKCKKCGVCVAVCPQNAIKVKEKEQTREDGGRLGFPTQQYEVVEEYCIGCFRCKALCKFAAIGGYSKIKNIDNFLNNNISCIELHASDVDENEVDEIWEYLNANFDGMLSICIGRAKLSDEKVLARVKKLIDKRKPYTTIIQADGSPMSGGEDDFKTTLQAVAMGELVQKLNLPVYVLLSGGTNSKSAQLARLCGVNFNGIAVGSYARKIVKDFINREDFWTNKATFEEALKIAENLILSTI